MSTSTMAKQIKVVQFPFSAFGHIVPHFQLAISLATSGVHVFFVSTPKNLQRIPKIPPPLSGLITLIPLPLPPLPGGDSLPGVAEATMDLPDDKVPLLKLALDLLEPCFRKFVADLPNPPDWFIVDFNATWICDVSRDFGIPFLFFNNTGIGFLAHVEKAFEIGVPDIDKLTTPFDYDGFQSTIAYRRFEASAMLNGSMVENSTGIVSDRDRVAQIQSGCKAILLRSCHEWDPHYLNFLCRSYAKKVIPVGFLPPEKHKTTNYSADSPWKSNFEWLNKQNPQTVVFVGFGSECKLTRDQLHSIAHGLELSDLPFLWTLRKPAWAADCDSDGLPLGFRERTAERGIVSTEWAPQMEILEHPAIGGCLFHGGWGTTIEALQFGHCFVLLPFSVDQPCNARFLVEKEVAVEVERNEDDGSFSGEAIAKALTDAFLSEQMEKLRINAKQAAAIFADTKLQRRYTENLIDFLRNEKD